MNKSLVHNEAEFVALFTGGIGNGRFWDRDELEKFLHIEFAFMDGKYQPDMDLGSASDPTIDDSQTSSDTIYKKHSEECFSTEYPCLVLWANEEDHDRQGKIGFEMLDFVYPSDFQARSPEKAA